MLKSRGRGKRIANDLLEDLKIPEKAPINVDAIVARFAEERKMSVEVLEEDFSKDMAGVSAILLKEKNKVVIAVNKKHPRQRRRFSLAHELGHLVMHSNHEHLNVEKGIQYKLFTRAEGVHSIDEKEANEFAAELLMPEDLIKKYFRKFIKNHEDTIISKLAEEFDVSEIALQYRLNNLDLVEFN
jgi:Zn-dependent peptidase ImmA (M78 family)